MRIGLIGSGRIGEMHARALRDLDAVTSLVVGDADPARAGPLAQRVGADAVDHVDEMYRCGVEGVVIAAATSAHAGLLHQALDEGVAVFCEKPLALDVAGTREVVSHARVAGVPLQVGFQRRFDPGYRAAKEAFEEGRLGWLHTLRAVTADEAPPPAEYIPTSGGLFRDCGIHDFDAMRWLTGREVESVSATGSNRGASFFAEGGDVDTAAALLTFDDGMLATVSATRYNGAGHDVRLEVCGSDGALFVGSDDRSPMPSAEAGVSWPAGTPYRTFVERFADAYVAELREFVEVAAGSTDSPCTASDALEALYVAEACRLSAERVGPVAVAEVRTTDS